MYCAKGRQTAELVFDLGTLFRRLLFMEATNGPGLWLGLPCKSNQEPENKRPKIE